jgi:hypothetical protein
MKKQLHYIKMAIVAILVCTATYTGYAQGQASIVSGRTPSAQSNFFFVRGQYNGFAADDYSLVGSTCDGGVSGATILAAGAGANSEFLIHNDNNKNNGYGNRWTVTGMAYGTPTNTTYPGGAGNSTMASNFVNGNYYSFRMRYNGNGFTANRVAVHSTAFKPANFTHVSATDNKVVGCVDKAPVMGEYLYLRYSIDNGATYKTLPITLGAVAGTTGSDPLCFTITMPAADVAAPTATTGAGSFTFYVMNSTLATVAAVTAAGADVDLMSLNDYGTDGNGSGFGGGSANGTCPKMYNFRTRTNFRPVCLPEGGFQGVTIGDDAAVDACKYILGTEAGYASPLYDPSADATASDFAGESSAYTYFTGTQDGAANGFDYANNWSNTNTGSNADIRKFYTSWDPTYLYLFAEGNSANWSNSNNGIGDIMDMFILIDTDNDIAANVYATGANTPAAHLPFNKRVDCNGWKPNYCVAIEGGDNGNEYASLHSVGAGAPVVAGMTDNDDDAEAACPSFEFRQRANRTEVRIPWAAIGGQPISTLGAKMNFAVYTTFNDDGYDTYDNAPGLGQGHGKPFEQVGDAPWDGDHWGGHLDPVTGMTDGTAQSNFGEAYNADPYDSPVKDQGPGDNQANSGNGRQPGSDRANNILADTQTDFDTIEEYYSIKNVGQTTSSISCATLPDGGAAVNIACGDAPAAKVGTIEIVAGACDVDQNPFSGAYDPYNSTQGMAMKAAITASAFVAAGGDLNYISGGGRCAEKIIITAVDVESGKSFVSACPDPCAGKKEKITRTYTITHKDKITNPTATCAARILADQVNTCAQVFTRTSANPACPLPINLLYFDADLKGNDVELTWTTSQEQNADKFNVQRSLDGERFETIGTVKATGNSNTKIEYAYTDENINQNLGRAYYRIQSVDFDGRSQVWTVRTVKFRPDAYSINLIPNPAQDVVNINIAALVNANTTLSIYNTMGQQVYNKNFTSDVNNATNFEINLNGYAKGLYQVVVRSGNNIASQKLVVK